MNPCRPRVERVLYNGHIRTQDDARPLAEAVAVGGGRILAVGANDKILAGAEGSCEKIDLGGRLVLPGMIDAHFHYFDWAMGRRGLQLAGLSSLAALCQAVSRQARATSRGGWILGQGFNETDWPEQRLPTARDLDAAAPDHAVILWRTDLHLAVANSTALQRAGIDAGTPDPPRGIIQRDSNGRPDGILREMAINRVKAIIPRPGPAEVAETMQAGLGALHALGLTGLHDIRLMDDPNSALALGGWQQLQRRNQLTLRCWVTLPGEQLDAAIALGLRTGFGDQRLKIGHVKYFADGGMGARTAWMLEPYLDGGLGMPLTPMADLEKALHRAQAAGLAVMIHAIGDRTNRELITVFEKLLGDRPPCRSGPWVPHRMEHLQMIRTEEIVRLARLPVVACVQPHNLVIDMAMIDACAGARGRFTYPFRDLLTAGIAVCFSSDSPVCDPSPLAGIHAAVTRQRPDNTPAGGWYPDQRITVAEAVRGYTRTPAIVSGADAYLGSITAGKRADLIVLDRDIFACDPADIRQAQILLTLFDGRVVHRRPDTI